MKTTEYTLKHFVQEGYCAYLTGNINDFRMISSNCAGQKCLASSYCSCANPV